MHCDRKGIKKKTWGKKPSKDRKSQQGGEGKKRKGRGEAKNGDKINLSSKKENSPENRWRKLTVGMEGGGGGSLGGAKVVCYRSEENATALQKESRQQSNERRGNITQFLLGKNK